MISCWNCRGIYGNYKYAKTILNQVDIMAISEHWLYEDELYFLNELNNEFGCYAKSSFENNINYRWRRGQGGVALLWNKSKISVQKIYTNSDRMVALRLAHKNNTSIKLVVCSVYLPSTNSTMEKFKNTLDLVESFCAHLSDSRSGQLENTRGKLLRMMFNKFNMKSINTQDYCSGSKYTYVSATGNTVVDYVFFEHTMQKFVKSAHICQDNPENTAYHLPVVVSLNFPDLINADNVATCNVIQKIIIIFKAN